MLNNFERSSAIPDEEMLRLSDDNLDHDLATKQNPGHGHSETIGESDYLSSPDKSEPEQCKTKHSDGSVRERNFEHTREGDELRAAGLNQLERKMRQLREDFAKQYAQDQVNKVEKYFQSDISEAENGEQVEALLHKIVVDKVMAGITHFIETGNQESIPPLFVQLQKTTYPFRNGSRHFLVGISVSSGAKDAVKEHLDIRPQGLPESIPREDRQ
jgi:hypothetical protein